MKFVTVTQVSPLMVRETATSTPIPAMPLPGSTLSPAAGDRLAAATIGGRLCILGGSGGGAATTVTVAAGTTTTGAPGTNAAVSNSGTSTNAVFNFTIPAGATGATGASVRQGTGAPASTLGNVGDVYIDTATGDVYQKS